MLFLLLENAHFKATNGSENGKEIKMDLTSSSSGPLKFSTSIYVNMSLHIINGHLHYVFEYIRV
jgi:hypothetical protein